VTTGSGGCCAAAQAAIHMSLPPLLPS